jgi:hypothetical protein
MIQQQVSYFKQSKKLWKTLFTFINGVVLLFILIGYEKKYVRCFYTWGHLFPIFLASYEKKNWHFYCVLLFKNVVLPSQEIVRFQRQNDAMMVSRYRGVRRRSWEWSNKNFKVKCLGTLSSDIYHDSRSWDRKSVICHQSSLYWNDMKLKEAGRFVRGWKCKVQKWHSVANTNHRHKLLISGVWGGREA